MLNEINFKKCNNSGTILRVIKKGDCKKANDNCTNSDIINIVPNSVDAAVEKHVPTYEVKDGKLIVKVNHVMEDEHYIEWIMVSKSNEEYMKKLKPGEEATLVCDYEKDTVIYSYCNKHGLWKNEVK